MFDGSASSYSLFLKSCFLKYVSNSVVRSASRFQIGGDGPVYFIFACYACGLFVWFHMVHYLWERMTIADGQMEPELV